MRGTGWLALALAAGFGCTEQDLALDDANPSFAEGDSATGLFYRIDVVPPTSAGELLPASFAMDPEVPAQLVVRPPVAVSGCVTGYVLAPTTADAQLPGARSPVGATVRLGIDNSVQSALGATSTDDGCYALRLVPHDAYELTVVTGDAQIPFIFDVMSIQQDTVLDVDLGTGVGLWGTVADGRGTALAGAEVWAEDVYGTRGPSAFSDLRGHFTLRVDPGSYTVVSAGRGNGRDPRIQTPLLHVDDGGAEVDLTYPTLETVSVGGRIVAPSADVAGSVARFVAVALDGYPADTTLAVEASANGLGNFDTRLVPGTWRVALIPAASRALTPVDLGEIVVRGESDLGTTTLPPLATFDALVVDLDGFPVPDALAECTELGFDQRTFRATATATGTVHLAASDVPLRCLITPPAARPDLAVTAIGADAQVDDAPVWTIDPGATLEGTVLLDVDGTGEPLGGALIEVRDTKGRFLGTTLTSPRDGSFAIRVGWLE